MQLVDLDIFRQQGDPLADQVLTNIWENEDSGFYNEFFIRLIQDIGSDLKKIEGYAYFYLRSTTRMPEWVAEEDLLRSYELFRNHSRKLLTILYFKSLPLLYFNAHGAKVLVATTRLMHCDNRNDVYTSRIAQTARFIITLFKPNSLDPGAAGIRTVQRVRLIHAFTRQTLLRSQSWDKAHDGVPINQEDMAMTLLCFSLVLLHGLKQMGIKVAKQYQESFFRTWMGIGSLLGVSPTLLPADLCRGRELLDLITRRNGMDSEGGKELTEALILFAQQNMPWMLRCAPASFIRFFDPTVAGHLIKQNGLQASKGNYIPVILKFYLQTDSLLKNHFPVIYESLFARRSHLMMTTFDSASSFISRDRNFQ